MLKQTLNMMELEVIFGREHTQLSRLQYHLIERLYGQHSWLVINNMDYCAEKSFDHIGGATNVLC